MTANRKRLGDAAEAAIAHRLELAGEVVFPLSPSYPGVDLLSIQVPTSANGPLIRLIEVKNHVLSPGERLRAWKKLRAAWDLSGQDPLFELRLAERKRDGTWFFEVVE